MTSPVVVVTGCAGGVGSATVDLLHGKGWYVVGIDRSQPGESHSCDEWLVVDLEDSAALQRAAAGIAQRHPAIAGLVNNGAIQDLHSVAALELASLTQVVAVNVGSAHILTRELATALRDAHGAIVNVASVHAVASTPNMAAYASSKGALVAYTRVTALELAPEVRVNAVLPGAVDTPMLAAGLARRPQDGARDEALAALAARAPLGRVARPVEVATVIEFLLDGERSSFITGQGLVVDGGVTVRLPSE
ncbi:MAG: SDR family NAD(P)-dependent oxidoreductase [Mycobacteriales bacterium]|nr:SDR family oxidoreductase [Frankia sp.]